MSHKKVDNIVEACRISRIIRDELVSIPSNRPSEWIFHGQEEAAAQFYEDISECIRSGKFTCVADVKTYFNSFLERMKEMSSREKADKVTTKVKALFKVGLIDYGMRIGHDCEIIDILRIKS